MDRDVVCDDLQIDEPTCIRVACLDSTDVLGESDFSALKIPLRALDRSTRINPDVVATLIASLRTKVVELEGHWRELSVSSGGRISNAVSEHRKIITSSSEIQRNANDMAAAMQRLGGDFSERIHALVELDLAYTRMVDTRALFDRVLVILFDIQNIYTSIRNGEWYHAAKVYRSTSDAHRDFLLGQPLAKLERKHKQQDQEDMKNRKYALEDNCNHISKFLLATLDGIGHQIEQAVSSMLTDWLSLSSSLHEEIGMDAMSVCALENTLRTLELDEKGYTLRDMTLQEGSIVSSDPEPRVACVIQQRRDIRNLVQRQVDIISSNSRLLLKAASIERAFLDSSRIREQYIQAREGQLGTLLIPPGGVEEERLYFHRLVGFFLVDIDIYINIPWFDTKEHLQTTWEGTSSAIVAEVGALLDEASTTQGMVDLKTSALHACESLEKYNLDIINTKPIRDVFISKVDKFLNILHEPTMVSLEAADGDVELLAVSVRACLHSITAYLEGLVPNNSLHHSVTAEANKMFSKLMLPLLSIITDAESCDTGVPDKLLAFIETTSFIQELLILYIQQHNGLYGRGRSLELLLHEAICELCSILGKKIVKEAMESMQTLATGHETTSNLINPWADSIIEQFEFYRQEFIEYEFSEHLGNRILASLADKIAKQVCLHFENYVGDITEIGMKSICDDLDALKKSFSFLGLNLENNVLLDMLRVSKAISTGDADTFREMVNTGTDDPVFKFAITFLENYSKSSKQNFTSLSVEKAKRLANKLRACSAE